MIVHIFRDLKSSFFLKKNISLWLWLIPCVVVGRWAHQDKLGELGGSTQGGTQDPTPHKATFFRQWRKHYDKGHGYGVHMHPKWGGGQPNFVNARILGAYGPPTHPLYVNTSVRSFNGPSWSLFPVIQSKQASSIIKLGILLRVPVFSVLSPQRFFFCFRNQR